jgi:DMSO/TMAO reductase YedYZ molybdopterin-dependent catalytic subunit
VCPAHPLPIKMVAMDHSLGRRDVLRAGLVWGGVAFLGPAAVLAEGVAAQSCDGAPLGELVGTVPLHGDRPRPTPFGRIVGGRGLDARLFTDLSTLDRDRLITPSDQVFVRTEAPAAMRTPPAAWSIGTGGFTSNNAIPVAGLMSRARPMGAHLIECSGNTDPDNFGLMSVAEWDGVPVAELLDTLGLAPGATAVVVSGVDDTESSRSSAAGASWVFTLDSLRAQGAFLAVRMNGEPLTPDHGAPVRLVVPGWYGCSWIKWVDAIRVAAADEATTTQMREFSLRTHQGGIPALARDYAAPIIDLAAMPIRIEKRRVGGRLEYRVVGIVWGGDRPVDRLAIRFSAGDTPQAFALCPAPRDTRAWSLWDYRWRPASPGLYSIALTCPDPTVRTRRLDVSFYVRRVVIDDV